MEKLEQDKHDLEQESDNDNHVESFEQKPAVMENGETFHYEDGRGKKIGLSSSIYTSIQLAQIASEFLQLKPLEIKNQPTYTA